MTPKIIVIDIHSVFEGLSRPSRTMTGIPATGLKDYIQREQDKGSSVYFICGAAHEPFARQSIEHFLERIGLRAVFVTHGLPDGFDVFISSKAFKFDREHFPVPQDN
jgi:hypothetical protein